MAMQETRFPGNPETLREFFKADIALQQALEMKPAERANAIVKELDGKMDAAAAEHSKRGGQIVRRVFIGRNDPCPCGSGVKYKRCHGA